MIVCTAKECLAEFEAEYRVLEETHIMTALGVVVVLKITKAGNCLVAGPSTVQATKAIIDILKKYNCYKILIDGAFSKTAFASTSEAIIYSIGASYSATLDKTVEDAKYTLDILGLPKYNGKVKLDGINKIALIDNKDKITLLTQSSTLDDASKILSKITEEIIYIYIPKAVSKSFIKLFIEKRSELNCDLIIGNPTSLVLDNQLTRHIFLLKQKVYVLNPINVIAITYNPFSPMGYNYNSKDFYDKLSSKINLPIYNVLKRDDGNGKNK